MAAKVLIVDDEAHILQVLRIKLANAGFEVLEAVDGEDGLEVARAHRPDLVITDFHMPYMTGLELVRAMAEEPELAETPVLLLTARGYALSDEELAGTRIVGLLGKPFSPRDVLDRVNAVLDGAGGAEAEAAAA